MISEDTKADVVDGEESIRWFHENLELLIEDVRLEGRVDVYFDTGDLRAVVLGMYYFYDTKTGGFQWKNFRSDTVLVHWLAAAGWLGKVSMLPSHRAEFRGLMHNDFSLAHLSESPRQLARNFLRQGFRVVAAEDRLGDIDVEDLQGLEGDKLVESFGGKAELAKEFFKLLQCIKGSWRTRLMAWDKYLSLRERDSFDPVPCMKEDAFIRVKQELDHLRPDMTINNVSDALAVASLVVELRAFQEDPVKRNLPLLFDHPGDLQKAIRKAGLEESLRYRGSRKSFSVLRDWRYFFLRATFGHGGKEPRGEKELVEILEKLDNISRGRKRMEKEIFGAIDSSLGNINQLIDYIKEFGFFGNIWLASWKDDLGRVISELEKAKLIESDQVEAIENLQSKEIRQKFVEAKEALDRSFEQSVGLYHGIIDLLRAIDTRARKIRRGLTERNRSESDIILILGSFRFPFAPAIHEETAMILSDLASRDTDKRIEAQAKVISALSESRAGERLSDATLSLLLGVLWATELDQEILDLAEGRHLLALSADNSSWTEMSFVFALVWLAAVVRLTFGEEEKRYWPDQFATAKRRDELRLALVLLDKSEVLLESKQGAKKAGFAVSIAYIQFHIFTSLCPVKSERWPDDLPHKNFAEFLESAVTCAKLAWQTEELDEKRRLYALNQYLYYMAEGIRRGAQIFKNIEDEFDEAARRLVASEGKEGWHYRYDDSLARYYAIVAQERSDKASWERGRIHIERAIKNCFDDPLIVAYHRSFIEQQEKWETQQR